MLVPDHIADDIRNGIPVFFEGRELHIAGICPDRIFKLIRNRKTADRGRFEALEWMKEQEVEIGDVLLMPDFTSGKPMLRIKHPPKVQVN